MLLCATSSFRHLIRQRAVAPWVEVCGRSLCPGKGHSSLLRGFELTGVGDGKTGCALVVRLLWRLPTRSRYVGKMAALQGPPTLVDSLPRIDEWPCQAKMVVVNSAHGLRLPVSLGR